MRSLAFLLALSVASVAGATVENFTITMTVGQATTAQPGAAGSGSGTATLDTDTNLFSWDISFAGLTGDEFAAHFHEAPVGVPGPILLPLPLGSPKVGSATLSDLDEAAVLASLWYANIHTTHSVFGELRGQVLLAPAAPVPSGVPALPLWGLVGLGTLLLGSAIGVLRHRSRARA